MLAELSKHLERYSTNFYFFFRFGNIRDSHDITVKVQKFRVEVGAQGMGALLRVLETDRSDSEICGYALDALSYVISGSEDDEDGN